MRPPFKQRGGITVSMVAGGLGGAAISTALGYTALGATVIFGSLTVAAVVGGVAGMAISRVASSLLGGNTKKPSGSSAVEARNNGQQVNVTATDEPIPVAIGYCDNVPAIVSYRDVGGPNNQYFYMICVASEGEIGGFDGTYLDGVISTDPKFNGLVTIETHTGADNQAASPMLLAAFPDKFTADDTGAGIAYAVLRLQHNPTAFPRGEPVVSFSLRGILMTDTRDSVSRFTNNPAFAIRTFWSNTRWGRRIATSAIVESRIDEEADYYDERVDVPSSALTFTVDSGTDVVTWSAEAPFDNGDGVTLSTSGTLPGGLSATKVYYIRKTTKTGQFASTYANSLARTAVDITGVGSGTHTGTHTDQPRYTCNGLLDPTANPYDNLTKLKSCCRSWFFEAGGEWHLIADKLVAGPYKTINEDVIVGEWTIDLGGEEGRYNKVTARFLNPFNNNKADFAVSKSDTEKTADGGRLLEGRLELPFTTNPYMGKRLAVSMRKQSRLGIKASHTVTVAGFQHFCGDVIEHTHSTPGWTDKLMRIMNIQPKDNDELMIEVHEYADSAYDEDEQDPMVIPLRTNLLNAINVIPFTPPDVSGLEIYGQGNDTNFTGPDCRVVWRESSVNGSRDWFRHYRVRVMVDGEVVRTEYLLQAQYIYAFQKNFDDQAARGESPARTYTLMITQMTRHSPPKESAGVAMITVSNAAPAAVAPTVTRTIKGLNFRFPPVDIPDFAGFTVWGSTSTGFTPGSGNVLYDGKDNEFTLANLDHGAVLYYRYCTKDTFGPGTVSSETSATVGVQAVSEDIEVGAVTEVASAASGSTLNPFNFNDTRWPTSMGNPQITNQMVVQLLSLTPDQVNESEHTVAGSAFIERTDAAGPAVTVSGATLRYFDVLSKVAVGNVTIEEKVGTVTTTHWGVLGGSQYYLQVDGVGTSFLTDAAEGDYVYLGIGQSLWQVGEVVSNSRMYCIEAFYGSGVMSVAYGAGPGPFSSIPCTLYRPTSYGSYAGPAVVAAASLPLAYPETAFSWAQTLEAPPMTLTRERIYLMLTYGTDYFAGNPTLNFKNAAITAAIGKR